MPVLRYIDFLRPKEALKLFDPVLASLVTLVEPLDSIVILCKFLLHRYDRFISLVKP